MTVKMRTPTKVELGFSQLVATMLQALTLPFGLDWIAKELGQVDSFEHCTQALQATIVHCHDTWISLVISGQC